MQKQRKKEKKKEKKRMIRETKPDFNKLIQQNKSLNKKT